MRRFIFGLVLISIFTCYIGACAVLSDKIHGDGLLRNPSLNIMVDRENRIPKSCRYVWGPHYYRVQSDAKFNLAEVDERLRSSIKNELDRRGYHEAEENSELIVSFAAGLNAELDDISINNAYGDEFRFSFPQATPDKNRIYSKGALVIDVLDAKTRKLYWRGTILADLDMKANEQAKDRRVKQAVRALLDHFPIPRTAN